MLQPMATLVVIPTTLVVVVETQGRDRVTDWSVETGRLAAKSAKHLDDLKFIVIRGLPDESITVRKCKLFRNSSNFRR